MKIPASECRDETKIAEDVHQDLHHNEDLFSTLNLSKEQLMLMQQKDLSLSTI